MGKQRRAKVSVGVRIWIVMWMSAGLASLAQEPAQAATWIDKKQVESFATLDELYLRVAEDVPSFAGLFYEDGNLVAVLALPKKELAALREPLAEAIVGVFGPEIVEAALEMRLASARYSTGQLQEWYPTVRDLHARRGVFLTDVDERRNLLAVAVTEDADLQALAAELTKAGLPQNAFRIEVQKPFLPTAGVRDRIRPVVGGLQIRRASPPGTCTLAWNVLFESNVRGYVTASHCTAQLGAVGFIPTFFYQAAFPNSIGSERFDPAFVSSPLCPTSAFADGCRWSDSVLLKYNNQPSSHGKIARLGSWGLGNISTLDPDYDIAALPNFILGGTRVLKVGRRTGKTAGLVGRTCFDLALDPWWNNREEGLLCQYDARSAAGVGGGVIPIVDNNDSGAPVFQLPTLTPNPTHQVFLYGILHSGNEDGTVFAFSPSFNVLIDMIPMLPMSFF